MKNVTLTQARNTLLKLAGELEDHPRTVVEVRKRGKPVMALLSAEMYEALAETLELLGDESLAGRLQQALKEIEGGKGIPWQRAKKRLGVGR